MCLYDLFRNSLVIPVIMMFDVVKALRPCNRTRKGAMRVKHDHDEIDGA